MKTTSIEPNRTLLLKFEPGVPNPRVIFEVRSDSPVTTYLVDDMGLEDFKDGRTPNHYARFDDRRIHQANLTLPNFSRYHLIISNRSPEHYAKVEYDVRHG